MLPSMSASSLFSTSSSSLAFSYEPHWKLYPLQYEVSRAPSPEIIIDGDLTKDCWKNVPWSEDFGDIQGDLNDKNNTAPITHIPRTRFKAMYDDEYLYIGGELVPAPNRTTEAHCTERNQVIYKTDSDFEVFIDAYGTNHNYKELEINARNIVWNLMLDKPYRDGGHEHSARVAPNDVNSPDYYEVYHQQTATRILHGSINDYQHHQGAYWTVEMALAYSDLLVVTNNNHNHHPNPRLSPSQSTPPPGSSSSSPSSIFWRVNFSRVEDRGNINWTWQSQNIVWDPSSRKYRGVIDMHIPESWGYFHFSNHNDVRINPGQPSQRDHHHHRDPLWPAKLTATTLYAALHFHKDATGEYTSDLAKLIVPPEIMAPFHITINVDKEEGFLVTVASRIDSTVVSIRDDRFLQVLHS
jgi:hypothetical protein